MTTQKVTMINGDGIGPEVVDAVRKILEGAKAPLEFEFKDAGAEAITRYGTNLPDETVESVMRNRIGLKGPTATGIGMGQQSANVGLRKRLDLTAPVDLEEIQECIGIACQAPTGGNVQDWRWMVVTDADKRAKLAELSNRASTPYFAANRKSIADRGVTGMNPILDSAEHLAAVLQDVPVHIIPCIFGRPDGLGPFDLASWYGRIFPAQVECIHISRVPKNGPVSHDLAQVGAIIRQHGTAQRPLPAGGGVHVVSIPSRILGVFGSEAQNSRQRSLDQSLRALVRMVHVEHAIERIVRGKR